MQHKEVLSEVISEGEINDIQKQKGGRSIVGWATSRLC